MKVLTSKVIIRNDTENNWITSQRILLEGELALSKDNNGFISMKSGDGVHLWKDLPFLKVNISDVKELENELAKKASKDLVDQIKIVVDSLGTLAFKNKVELSDINAEDLSQGKVNVSRLHNDELLVLNCGTSQSS